MRKLLISLLAVGSASAFAMGNNLFQEFDNQIIPNLKFNYPYNHMSKHS